MYNSIKNILYQISNKKKICSCNCKEYDYYIVPNSPIIAKYGFLGSLLERYNRNNRNECFCPAWIVLNYKL